jgi:hypothetical protein
LPLLVQRLEEHRFLDRVELWSLSAHPGEQMRLIRSIGRDAQERLDFMAAYYSLQFLHMNLLALDRLELALPEAENRPLAYREFLGTQAARYQSLNAVYVDALLEMFLAGAQVPEFCICVVGTRSDQDDVDILVINEEEGDRESFNRAVGKVAAEFFRRAGRLHMYIAERMGISAYSNTIGEYARRLQKDMTDFVMISELLSAEPLVGSWNVFTRFRRRVMDRFIGRRRPWRRYHEAFLRGLLGEMHALIVHDVSRDRIDFKNDSLRLAKGMALAGKAVHNLRDVDPVEVLDSLAEHVPALGDDIGTLRDSLLFVETCRLLYQMLEVQEEIVELRACEEAPIRDVAQLMGYTEKGGVDAADQLLVNYYQSVERIRLSARKIMAYLTGRLKQTSIFPSFAGQGKRRRNLAAELAETVRLFHGHIFLDDILDWLRQGSGQLAATFVADVGKLKGPRRLLVLDSFLELAEADPMTLLELLLTVKGAAAGGGALFDLMLERFIARVPGNAVFLSAMLDVFNSAPALVNRFIEALRPTQRRRFEALFESDLRDVELQETLGRFRKYVWLRTAGSEFYRRMFRRVINRHPHFIRHLGDPERLRRIASGFLVPVEPGLNEDAGRAGLAEFYDVSYLACAVEALTGKEVAAYRASFVEFVDSYMGYLFSFCNRLAGGRRGDLAETADRFAVFATGGFGRGQAFDDDYDMVFLADTDDPALLEHFKAVATAMHRELVRRTTLPQYRFADHFGDYVTTFAQLKDWFLSGRADAVDATQLVGARMVVGSSALERRLLDEILSPAVFARHGQFMAGLVREGMDRRGVCGRDTGPEIPLKDGAGGLRDIEEISMILKAAHGIPLPLGPGLVAAVAERTPTLAPMLEQLMDHHSFLRRVRDLYRLGVAAHDDLQVSELGMVAQIMGITTPDGRGDAAALSAAVRDRMTRISALLSDLLLATSA